MDVLVRGTAGVGGDAGDAIEFKDITSNYDNAITKKAGRLHLREASRVFIFYLEKKYGKILNAPHNIVILKQNVIISTQFQFYVRRILWLHS